MNIFQKIMSFFKKQPLQIEESKIESGDFETRFIDEYSIQKSQEVIEREKRELKRQDQIQFAYRNLIRNSANINKGMREDLEERLGMFGHDSNIVISDLDISTLANIKYVLGSLKEDDEVIQYLNRSPESVVKAIDKIEEQAIINSGKYGALKEEAAEYITDPVGTIKKLVEKEKSIENTI